MTDIEIPERPSSLLEALSRPRPAFLVAGGVVLVVGMWLALSRGAPAQIAPPAVTNLDVSLPQQGSGTLLVHVAGAVRTPGLYPFPDGARVADAIAAAGGATKRGDIDALNLAQLLMDGLKIQVPKRGAPVLLEGVDSPSAEVPTPVAINSADLAALESIPGIGPVRAQAILVYRTEHGGFSALEELLEVSGIGPATFELLRDHVTL